MNVRDVLAGVLDVTPGGWADSNMQKRVWRLLHQEYIAIARRASWEALREKTTLSLSGTGTAGVGLPGDLLGIDGVYSSTTREEYFAADRHDAEGVSNPKVYFTVRPNSEPLASLTDVSISTGSDKMTSAALDSISADGEIVWLYGGLDPFEIESSAGTPKTYTLSRTYYGPAETGGGVAIVRKPAEQNIVLLDGEGTVITNDSIDVYYWRYPHLPYSESDDLFLPVGNYMVLSILAKIPEARAYAPVASGQVQEAFAEEVKNNRQFTAVPKLSDKRGKPWTFSGANLYGYRD